MENITDSGYNHAKRICNDFEIKNFGEYHDKSDTLLADAFENFQKLFEKFLSSGKNFVQLLNYLGSSFNKEQSKIRIIN